MTAGAVVSLGALAPEARQALADLATLLGPARPAWLVGGAVRDMLQGGGPADLDVAVPSGALGLGRALADATGAAFVTLDEARRACRVAGRVLLDLADFRGPDLAADLAGRDFTVNALAASVHALVGAGQAPVEDATGGLGDLAARLVRLCAPAALRDDPVRALRAARLALRPGWRLDPEVERAAREVAAAVPRASAERLRDALIAILAPPGAGRGLRLLDRWEILAALLPDRQAMRDCAQPAPHRFDVWEHSLRTVEAADLLAAHPEELGEAWEGLDVHLALDLGDGLMRGAALKLAGLLHDIAKPRTRALIDGRVRFLGHDIRGAERAAAIAGRFRLSRRATQAVERLVRHHLRPMHLALAGGASPRARHRFFRDLGDEARGLLLLALADAAAVAGGSPVEVWRGPGGEVVRALVAGLREEAAAAAAPALLSGEDVMAAFGLRPGPEVGRLLARAREAQALGLVATREAALGYLARDASALDTPEGNP